MMMKKPSGRAKLLVVFLLFGILGVLDSAPKASPDTNTMARADSSQPKTAPCFNDSGKDGSFGVWIYEGFSRWEEARENPRAPVLAFGFKPGKVEYTTADLHYCFYMIVEDLSSLLSSFSQCKSGSIAISHIKPRALLRGSYEFVLENGEIKKGRFNALYCPPKKE